MVEYMACIIFYIHLCLGHYFPLFFLSTKLIFLLIGIILYLQVTFLISNMMRNKGISVLFKFLCQYEVFMSP